MAKQLAKPAHYGIVNGWLASPKREIVLNRACRQALNKLTYNTYGGRMTTLKNGTRRNQYRFADGRILEATKLEDGSGNWKVEKCSA